jgi:hypothetical protein
VQEYAGEIKGGKFYFDRRKAFDTWCAGQKDGRRFIFRIVKDSPGRELSQSRAHFERCGIIGDEVGMDKDQVSHLLMQDAFDATQNPAFGKYVNAFGKEYFIPESTTTLSKDEFWKLKAAAYKRLQFLNEDRDPSVWASFPERGENGVILRMCYTWSERPEDRVPP